MKVLVTGAKGMLGQDLCPMLEDDGYEVIETDADSMDITDSGKVLAVFEAQKPDFVIHCAAYTNVDKAEEDFDTALLINEKGTENVAIAAAKADIPMVYIGTDYVFDGNAKIPYKPGDKTNPVDNYGLAKLKGEEAVQKHCKKYYITRTSWLYGHHGKNFVETMIALSKKMPEVRVVDDQIGCPTWTVALADAIIGLLDEEAEYGIYHICGSGKTSWYGFTKEIFKLAGIKTPVLPVTTAEFPRPAKRPAYSVMENDGICPDWKVSLKQYMELREDD